MQRNFCNDLGNYYKGFVICGGPYPSMDPETVISVDAVNAVCVGEGEDAVCELVESLEAGRDYTQIKNLWVKRCKWKHYKKQVKTFYRLGQTSPEDKELFDLKKILPLKKFSIGNNAQ